MWIIVFSLRLASGIPCVQRELGQWYHHNYTIYLKFQWDNIFQATGGNFFLFNVEFVKPLIILVYSVIVLKNQFSLFNCESFSPMAVSEVGIL